MGGRKLVDITGHRFGMVVAVKYLGGRSGNWRYLCDCGKYGETSGANLRQGRTASCGCDRWSKADLSGKTICGLKVVRLARKDRNRQSIYICECPRCGGEREVRRAQIVGSQGHCGCSKFTHNATYHPLFRTWESMVSRCFNKSKSNYKSYGAKGVTVCDRWRDDPWAFFGDMGVRPHGFTLDRINPFGDYEPSNCRWADKETQLKNTRRNAERNQAQ